MWKQLEELMGTLGLSRGQLLIIAREVTGNGSLSTIDLLSQAERYVLIGELQNLQKKREKLELFLVT